MFIISFVIVKYKAKVKMDSIQAKRMSLNFQNLFLLEQVLHLQGHWQRLKSSAGVLIFFCLRTRLWWATTWSSEQMKSMTWTAKMDNELANVSLTRLNVCVKYSKQTVRPEPTVNNSQKPTKYFIKRGVYAILQRFWTLRRKAFPTCGWTGRSMYFPMKY